MLCTGGSDDEEDERKKEDREEGWLDYFLDGVIFTKGPRRTRITRLLLDVVCCSAGEIQSSADLHCIGLFRGMWPHWEMYKQEVAQREGFYLHLGQAVVQVVEDCGIEEWAECVCCQAYAEEDPIEWDFAVEDIMGESDSFGKAVFAVYWSKVE